MRTCCLCRAEDHPVILEDMCNCKGGDDLAGHATGCKAIQHFVTKNFLQHKGPIPSTMKIQGWEAHGNFQGREVITRMLCRGCIRKQEDVAEIDAYKRKVGKEAEEGADMNMYQILCS